MLKNKLRVLVCTGLVFVSSIVSSWSAEPLGFRIGDADYNLVKHNLSDRILLRNGKPNRYSGGKVLISDAPEFLGVEGLKNLVFIFDPKDKLSAVVMKINKQGKNIEDDPYIGFLNVFDVLKNKYRLIKKDFSTNKKSMKAQFKSKHGVTIQMNAPKYASVFELRYLSNDFIKRYKAVKYRRATEAEIVANGQKLGSSVY